MRCIIEKRGQVWVETVIYTLIGLSIIALVLSAALPKIEEKKDRAAIEQSIDALGDINEKINDVAGVAEGNRRTATLDVKKGDVLFNMSENSISWILDSSFIYSELDTPISLGKIIVTTREKNPYEVELKMVYDFSLQYNDDVDGTKRLTSATVPYSLMIENFGKDADGKTVIKFSDY